MQPTPAPTSPPSSPPPVAATQTVVTAEDHDLDYPPPPANKGTAPFHVLASLFDRLQDERKPEKRRKLLDSWFNHWREQIGYDLYPVLRLILPQKDRERAVYGLKEKNLAKIYIKLIPLGRKDPDAIRLLNWKKPTERDKSSGDFPMVLYEVISKRSSVVEGTMTIDEVNESLDELSRNMGKSDIQSRIMQRIYNRTTPEEQRWIVRIILKDLVISVKETTVFSIFHPDAHDLFNTCSDLKKVAWELWDPQRRLNDEDKAVHLFRAFAPMLCKRPTRRIEDSVKEMQGRTFLMEEKLDGERMQLHKRGNEYFYCSRKGKDYTYLYGKHVGTGTLTPYIHDAFDPRVDEIILDGEMLVWDPVSERNLPFGTLKTAALDRSKQEHNPRPCFKVFDLLYLNGTPLLHKSLKFRKRNMKSCFAEVSGRFEFAKEAEGRTAKDIRTRMDEIIALRGEGLVLKHPDSEYVLNGRNRDWIKVKPEYMDNMGETVDVLVVAGDYGSGRRAGGVSTLICAVLDDRNQDEETKFRTFVRIGTGLSYADYIWIRSKPWKEWDPKNPPSFLQVARKGNEDKGDLYLEPEDSFIVKVKAAEIIPTDQYHLGFTMRFPRALNIRDDLGVEDCMTASAMLEMARAEKKRKMESEDSPKKKRRKTSKISLMPEYQSVNMKDVEREGDLFEGMKFMVASDPKSMTGEQDKQELMRLIHAHGGSLVQIARGQKDLLVVYGGTIAPYDIKAIMTKDTHDIIKPQWILDSIAKGERVPMTKKYFFHTTAERKKSDEYNQEDESEDEVLERTARTPSTKQTPAAEDKPKPIEEDPSMAEWFNVQRASSSRGEARAEDTESETEPDSENEDVLGNEDFLPDEDVDDEWFKVEPGGESSSAKAAKAQADEGHVTEDEQPDVVMGEDEEAREYDQELIFKHLLQKIAEKIIANGGRIVGLDELKLTHIIIDKRDASRRLELIRRTSTPRRRNLVISEFVQACLDEGTLLDEEVSGWKQRVHSRRICVTRTAAVHVA
ncbi:ATP-dependent DNA ligase [Obba rivulosa]|uniref:DNA ligase n=1 Tax=Obba rivulosa TaxID=1052685 RepID=A0A8E2AQ96_9APHY|nr:ATP-dependent DNA ligase [Obba rivulosa]